MPTTRRFQPSSAIFFLLAHRLKLFNYKNCTQQTSLQAILPVARAKVINRCSISTVSGCFLSTPAKPSRLRSSRFRAVLQALTDGCSNTYRQTISTELMAHTRQSTDGGIRLQAQSDPNKEQKRGKRGNLQSHVSEE
jgi:hypothetical protein